MKRAVCCEAVVLVLRLAALCLLAVVAACSGHSRQAVLCLCLCVLWY